MEKEKLNNKIGIYFFCIISLYNIVSCNHFWGIYPISENVLLWDRGTPYEKIIIYNDGVMPWKRVSGIPIIPSNNQFQINTKTEVNEYVKSFSNNKEWLLAKTIASADSCMQERYWIIHFSNIGKMSENDIADSTFGPFNKSEFDIVITQKQINKSLLTDFLSQK